jgi:hypothetical protein
VPLGNLASLLTRSGIHGPSSGSYDPAGDWVVMLPRSASVKETLMVSEHESMHSFLTMSTAYGALLNIVAATAADGSASSLAAMLDAARLTHEVVATAFGVWGSGYDPDELKIYYPGYHDYYERALAIAPGWPAQSAAKRCAVFTFGQVCMQAPLGALVHKKGLAGIAFDDLPDALLPDRRFTALATAYDADAWARLERAATQEHPAVVGGTGKPTAEAIDALQIWLYAEFAHMFGQLGYPVLAWKTHLEDIRPVFIAARASYPHAALPALADDPALVPVDIDTHLRIYGEHLVTAQNGLAAVVRDPNDASIPPVRAPYLPHILTVVRPLRRVLAQYRLTPAEQALVRENARRGEISVSIRGHAHTSEGAVLDIRPVAQPVFGMIDGVHVPSVITCSSSALDRELASSDPLRVTKGAVFTILFDTPPDVTLKDWHERGDRVTWAGGWILLPHARAYVMAFIRRDEGVPWIAIVSPATAGRLEQLAQELWGPRPDRTELGSLLNEIQQIAVKRVASEEPWFDFRGSLDYGH